MATKEFETEIVPDSRLKHLAHNLGSTEILVRVTGHRNPDPHSDRLTVEWSAIDKNSMYLSNLPLNEPVTIHITAWEE